MSGLHTLRDVDGVFGSFVMDGSGAVLARDLPDVFGESTLREAAERVLRLFLLSESHGEAPEMLVLTFRDYRLLLRSAGAHVLGVIAENRANLPALRMAMTLLLRRFASPTVPASEARAQLGSAPVLSRAPLPPTPAPPSVRASIPDTFPGQKPPATVQPSTPAAPTAPVRTYRGRPIS